MEFWLFMIGMLAVGVIGSVLLYTIFCNEDN